MLVWIKKWLRRIWWMPTGAWLAAGVIAINAAAAFPRGVADATPQDPITPYEWIETAVFPFIVVAFLISIDKPRMRSWVATISGGIWFGFACGSYLVYQDDIDLLVIIAYILFPLGVSFVSFSLARIADIERKAALDKEEVT